MLKELAAVVQDLKGPVEDFGLKYGSIDCTENDDGCVVYFNAPDGRVAAAVFSAKELGASRSLRHLVAAKLNNLVTTFKDLGPGQMNV